MLHVSGLFFNPLALTGGGTRDIRESRNSATKRKEVAVMLYYPDMSALDGTLAGLQAAHEVVTYELVRRVMEARSAEYQADRPAIVAEIKRLCADLGRFELRPEGLNRHFVLRKLKQMIEIASVRPTDDVVLGLVKKLQEGLLSRGWRMFPN